MYTVYILQSKVWPKTYVGFTNNIERRLSEHNSGKHFYTKRHLPWVIVYTEKYATLIEARQREKYFKSAAGRRYIKKFVFDR